MKQQSNIRINLGSGTDYRDGWINVDARTECAPDIVADITAPLPFPDGSANEVCAQDVFEHCTREDGRKFIADVWRVLQPGGFLTMRLPDVDAIIEKFRDDSDVMLHFIYGDTSESGVWGAHKAGYTESSLREVLVRAGFINIHVEHDDTNFSVTAVKGTHPSLRKHTIGLIQQAADMGGAEAYMCALAKAWRSVGHTIHAGTNEGAYASALRDVDVTVYTYKTVVDVIGDWKGLLKSVLTLPHSLYVYTRLLLIFKRAHVTCVVMSEFSERLVVAPLCALMRMKVVWIEYGRPRDTFTRMYPWSKLLFRCVKHIPYAVVTPTAYVRRSLIEDGRVSLAKIHVIPCGTDCAVQHRQSSYSPAKGQPLRIVCVSRVTREKGQEHLIRAFALVRKQHTIELAIVGRGPDEAYLRACASECGVAEYVHFLGYVDDKHAIYENCDLCVFPTVWDLEGFGLVIIEAMARGIPVIASDIGPVREVCGEAAMLVPPADVQMLADAIDRLVSDKKLRHTYGQEGRARCVALYDIVQQAHKMSDVFPVEEAYDSESDGR